MRVIVPCLLLALLAPAGLSAQTYSVNSNAPIVDVATTEYPLTVSGLSPATIDTTNFGLEQVCIDLTHTWDSDLVIELVAPDGTTSTLSANNGGADDNYTNTCFTDTAAISITAGTVPFTGYFRAQGQMGMVNNGQNGNGIWKLRITDQVGGDDGILLSWSVTFGNNPAAPYSVSATDLPLVVINTFNQVIPNDPKITAHMGIVDNGPGNLNHVSDPFNAYNNFIGIEVRGNSSQGFAQKQYRFETRDPGGNNNDTILLGMPKENDWILYGPYNDKSCLRNWMSYKLARDMGRYAVRGQFCEVVINNEYKGIYLLQESIKRDSNRVNVAKLNVGDLSGDAVTGGYIVKIDWIGGPSWQSNFPPDQTAPSNNVINFQLVYPDPLAVMPQQQAYIAAYIDSFETALFGPGFQDPGTGWRRFADEASFIDYHILNEAAHNVDAYWLSTYFHKERDSRGGKLRMGPVWDFNGAWRNVDYCNGGSISDWQYNEPSYCNVDMPYWWKRLLQDSLFTNNLQCRWRDLRGTVLDTTHIFHYMDSISVVLNQAQARHFTQWPILGVYVWPNPAPLANTFAEEIQYTKDWIIDRLDWIDGNIPGYCPPVGIGNGPEQAGLSLYPNPNNGRFKLSAPAALGMVTIFDVHGKVVQQFKTLERDLELNLPNEGVYFVSASANGTSSNFKVVVTR